MSELISGKDALIALANDSEVEFMISGISPWDSLSSCNGFNLMNFKDADFKFRLKPRTIKLNGIEVPAPFTAPENLDNSLMWYVLDTYQDRGYSQCRNPKHPSNLLGSWIHEEEIKQVVAALRQVFGG